MKRSQLERLVKFCDREDPKNLSEASSGAGVPSLEFLEGNRALTVEG